MSQPFIIASSFTFGLFFGIVIKKNWQSIRSFLFDKKHAVKSSAASDSKSKNSDNSEWEDIDSEAEVSGVIKIKD